jgi:hypothetical protein
MIHIHIHIHMKKLLTAVAVAAAFVLTVNAAEDNAKKDAAPEKKSSSLTAEQKALRKELMGKYDTNKNGYLDKEEKSKMTPEDQEKWNSVDTANKSKSAEKEKKAEKSEPKP